jgi:branched-chain amino acid transport system substrate-binding protein
MRKLICIAVAALVAAATAACGGGKPSGGGRAVTEVKIAGLWPLSGPNATQGTDVLHGAQLAVDIVNNAHSDIDLPLAADTGLRRLGGAKINLITGDTQGKPEVGASEVDRLVTGEKVAAVIGCYQSGVTLTASQRAERLGVPFVNEASSSVALTKRGLQWFFRTGPTDETFARTMFDYLDSQRHQGKTVRTVAVFHSNDQFGNDGANITKQIAGEHQTNVVVDVAVDPSAADLGSQVAQVRAANPDVLFVLAYTDAAIRLMRTLRQLNYYPPALLAFGTGFADPAFVTGLGPLANGVSTRAAWSADIAAKKPAAKAVADLFQKQFNAPMTENSARAFTAVLTLAQAIDAAKSTKPGAVRDALRGLNIPGDRTIMPWTNIKFDGEGQNAGAVGVVEQMFDGKYRVVFPADVATVQPVWPLRDAQAAR